MRRDNSHVARDERLADHDAFRRCDTRHPREADGVETHSFIDEGVEIGGVLDGGGFEGLVFWGKMIQFGAELGLLGWRGGEVVEEVR